MIKIMSFYLAVHSDNSPTNSVSHFITKLNTPIELDGDYDVAIASVIRYTDQPEASKTNRSRRAEVSQENIKQVKEYPSVGEEESIGIGILNEYNKYIASHSPVVILSDAE